MNFKAVIFDMDGVLIDSEPLHISVESNILKELGVPMKQEMYARFAGTTSLSMWKIIVEEFRLDKSPEDLAAENNRRFVKELSISDQVETFDGVVDVLSNLNKKGIPVALASSSSSIIVDAVLNRFNLKHYFNAVVTGSDVQHSKPNPEIFLKAAQRLNIDPSMCIVVEDSPNGIKAAHSAGMGCIGFASEKNPHDISHATWIIKSFGEFDYGLV
jgi:beta-phosphoglucomutase family hydrolase